MELVFTDQARELIESSGRKAMSISLEAMTSC